ncbi:MAG TPA: ABC transporter permease subunit [Pseudonocardiaceae bacterium]|jgi:hypothetical protein
MSSTVLTEERSPETVPSPAPPSPGMRVTQWRVLRSEWLKFWSLRSSFFSLGGVLIAMVGFGGLFAAITANRWVEMTAREHARFDPTAVSLRGYFLAQLVVGVLGVLMVTGEYSTGMIRSSLGAVPRRLPVLVAKAAVFAAVTVVATSVTAIIAFSVGQGLLSSQHIGTTLAAPGVARAVLGTGLYLTVVGLLGVGLGFIVRSTAGGIGTLFGLLLVLPVLAEALPPSWAQHISPYLPSTAGQQLIAVHQESGMLAPWTGFGVFCLYALVTLALGAVLLRRRDA